MIQTPSLLDELQRMGIAITANAGKLKIDAPQGTITAELAERIRAHKAELLQTLTPAPAPAPENESEQVTPAPAPFYRVIANTVPPLRCSHCGNVYGADYWRLNQLRNRWECLDCHTIGMLNYQRVIVASTGEDAITEAVRFLDDLAASGVCVRYYESGQCGVTVPEQWNAAQFEQVAQSVMQRDTMLRRLIPVRSGAPVACEQVTPAHTERHIEPLPVITAPAPAPAGDNAAAIKRWPISTEHASLSDARLVYHVTQHGQTTRESIALGESVQSLTALFDHALVHTLRVIWAVPGCSYSNLAPAWAGAPADVFKRERTAQYEYEGWNLKVTVTRAERGRDVIVNVVGRRDGKQVILTCPEHSVYDWRVSQVGQLDEITILAAIHYLHGALAIRSLNTNAGVQGRDLISRFVKADYLAIPELDYRAFVKPDMGMGYDLAFKRLPEESELTALYLVAIDKNSAYLGACTGAKLGTGTPRYIKGAPGFRPDVKLPGIWHIAITGELPPVHPLYRDSQGNIQRWLTSALLAWLYKNDVSIEIIEGWQWNEGHRTLEDWAAFLWNGRESLRTDTVTYPHESARALARYSIKRIATAGVGILANDKAFDYAPALYRPDWQRTIPELAAARLTEQVQGVHKAYGAWPLFIVTDALYYLTSTPDIRAAFPGKFDKAEGLGGWKYKFPPLALTPDVWNLLHDASYSAGTLAKAVETLALAKGE